MKNEAMKDCPENNKNEEMKGLPRKRKYSINNEEGRR